MTFLSVLLMNMDRPAIYIDNLSILIKFNRHQLVFYYISLHHEYNQFENNWLVLHSNFRKFKMEHLKLIVVPSYWSSNKATHLCGHSRGSKKKDQTDTHRSAFAIRSHHNCQSSHSLYTAKLSNPIFFLSDTETAVTWRKIILYVWSSQVAIMGSKHKLPFC